MKRITAFVFIELFALVFIFSYLHIFRQSGYGNMMNITGQIGMAIYILLFFIIPGRKKPPSADNKHKLN
ncbi:MAG: hypothetical protein ACHQD8_03415 [Chitinophagales bacterium]